jgi:hypothetical protein
MFPYRIYLFEKTTQNIYDNSLQNNSYTILPGIWTQRDCWTNKQQYLLVILDVSFKARQVGKLMDIRLGCGWLVLVLVLPASPPFLPSTLHISTVPYIVHCNRSGSMFPILLFNCSPCTSWISTFANLICFVSLVCNNFKDLYYLRPCKWEDCPAGFCPDGPTELGELQAKFYLIETVIWYRLRSLTLTLTLKL